MVGDYSQYQKWNTSRTTDVLLLATDAGKDNVIVVRSANHQLFIQKVVYTVKTAAAQAILIQDDAGTPVVIGTVPASQATPITFDFGPKGIPLTAGKNLDLSNTAGPAGEFHIEAYEKIVSGAINTGLAASAQ